MVFWVFAAGYSINMGMAVLENAQSWTIVLAMLGITGLATIYVQLGLRVLKRRLVSRVAMRLYEVAWFFLLNRYALLLFTLCLGEYSQQWLGQQVAMPVFLLAAAISFGSLAGGVASIRLIMTAVKINKPS
jgi:hypothetical protein